MCLVGIGTAVALGSLWPLAAPLGLITAMLVVGRLRWLYWLLVAALVLSVDLELPGGLGLDMPSEPLMMMFLIVGIGLFLAHPKRIDRRFFGHPIFVALLAYLAWVIVAMLFSSHPLLSAKLLASKLWYIGALTVMGGWFLRDHHDFKPVFWLLIMSIAGVALWQLYNFRAYAFDFEFVNKTMKPIYFNHVDYGVAIAMLLPFPLLLRRWYRSGSLARLAVDGCTVAMLAGLVYSYTRSAYVSAALIPFAWLIFRWQLVRWCFGAAMILAVLGGFYLANDNRYIDFAPNYDTTIQHFNFEDHLAATVAMSDLSTMERVYRWVAGGIMWQERPLTGFGPNTFTQHYRRYTSRLFETYVSDNEEQSTTHNYYLMTLIEQGIPGLLILLALCYLVLRTGELAYRDLRGTRNGDLTIAVSISMLLFLINNLMSDLFETDETGAFFYLYAGMLINLHLQAKRQAKRKASRSAIANGSGTSTSDSISRGKTDPLSI